MDTCLPPPPPSPPPLLSQLMEDSNFKLWYDSVISEGEHEDAGNSTSMKLEVSDIKDHQIAKRGGTVHGAMEMMKLQGVKEEDEREKDRVFWETCLASGYP